MYLHSISAIVDNIFDHHLDEEDILALKTTAASELPRFHLNWGMWIRNTYKLWAPDHPLTVKWHQFPDQRNIVDGIDMSANHPDAISMRVMEGVHKKANS
ncbi:hypothetical protein [Acinetobacter sp.]|uniref:hypothetical protein n=1 Tax=Acinetobacter sp. TaxID=472 RepID=UPI0038905C33